MMSIRRTCWILALTVVATGCELFRDLDEVKLENARCETGVTVECICENGASGTQTCNAGGEFEPCRCPTDAGSDAGDTTDGSTDDGSASDTASPGDSGPSPTDTSKVD